MQKSRPGESRGPVQTTGCTSILPCSPAPRHSLSGSDCGVFSDLEGQPVPFTGMRHRGE